MGVDGHTGAHTSYSVTISFDFTYNLVKKLSLQ